MCNLFKHKHHWYQADTYSRYCRKCLTTQELRKVPVFIKHGKEKSHLDGWKEHWDWVNT